MLACAISRSCDNQALGQVPSDSSECSRSAVRAESWTESFVCGSLVRGNRFEGTGNPFDKSFRIATDKVEFHYGEQVRRTEDRDMVTIAGSQRSQLFHILW